MEKKTASAGADILRYMMGQLPLLSARLGLGPEQSEELKCLLESAYHRETDSEEKPEVFMGSTAESKALVGFLMNRLVSSWSIEGQDHLQSALGHHRSGGRVVFMFNHIGNVDPPIVNHILKAVVESGLPMVWVAGRRVWESPFLRMFSRCVDMVTVFSEKYIRLAFGTADFPMMRTHNIAALRWMKKYRNLLCVFPQGTWCNTGQLTVGVPSVMAIPRIVSDDGKTDTIIVPCYLEGADTIMPPLGRSEGVDEFYLFLEAVRTGRIVLKFGEPLSWNDLKDVPPEDSMYTVMCRIADLAPTEKARGPYAYSLRQA